MKKLITMALSATLVGTMTLSMFGGIAGNAEEQEYYEGFLSDSSESTEATEYAEDVLPDLSEPTEATEYTEDILTDSSESTKATDYTEDVLPDLPEPVEETECREGLSPTPDELLSELYELYGEPTEFPVTYASLPSSVDLSTSPCFPDIGNQKNLGACAAFATTYYQYSYEVNKLNGVTSKDDRVIYSPKWTYNLINNGKDEGSSSLTAYAVLQLFGALKNSDLPYTGDSSDYKEWVSGMDTQKIEALETRVAKFDWHLIVTTDPITSPSDSKLTQIKQLLSNGKVLTTTTRDRWNSRVQGNESIAFRCYDGGSHALTIVGYDDDKSYDVNGNGIIEDCEKGAFKVANSWGTDFNYFGIKSNTGYFWVMYDALNSTSANTINNWESKYSSTTRQPAFGIGSTNIFFSIDVAHKKPNFIGRLTMNISDREKLNLRINRSTANNWSNDSSELLVPFSYTPSENHEDIPPVLNFLGKIYFDYDDFASPIEDYCTGYYWLANLTNISSNDTFYLAIIDNMSNVIKSNKSFTKSGSTASCSHNISIQKGDVNYDGKIDSNDENIVNNYNLQIVKFSNVQHYIGDFNNDGRVTGADTVALRRYILANGS